MVRVGGPRLVLGFPLMPFRNMSSSETAGKLSASRPLMVWSSAPQPVNALQNGSATAPLVFYAFDLMIIAGKDVMNKPLTARRALLQELMLAKLDEPIRESPELEASLPDLIRSVKAHGLGGPTLQEAR